MDSYNFTSTAVLRSVFFLIKGVDSLLENCQISENKQKCQETEISAFVYTLLRRAFGRLYIESNVNP